eukprot:5101143-Pyramimonas_sp.AAC.1
MLWRLPRGHRFHATCWDRAARVHLGSNRNGAPDAPRAVCLAVGVGIALCPYAGHRDSEAADNTSFNNATEMRDLRENRSRRLPRSSRLPARQLAVAGTGCPKCVHRRSRGQPLRRGQRSQCR